MQKNGNYAPQNGKIYHAHHIFPQKYRKIFKSIGIDVVDPNYGIWVEAHELLKNAYSYNKMWGKEIKILKGLKGTDVDQEFFNSLRKITRLW